MIIATLVQCDIRESSELETLYLSGKKPAQDNDSLVCYTVVGTGSIIGINEESAEHQVKPNADKRYSLKGKKYPG